MSGVASADALFRCVLGADRFDTLPAPLRTLHLRGGRAVWRGEVEVTRGTGLLSRLCAWATRLPRAGQGPIEVEIVAIDGREQWTRHVDGHAMRSRLWAGDGLLNERLGLVTFAFALSSRGDDIVWTVARVRVLGLLPLPVAWFSQVRACESAADDGRYRFEVVAALPLAGPLVHYRGWLAVA
jgi:Domain of unknown function (DUF4166)